MGRGCSRREANKGEQEGSLKPPPRPGVHAKVLWSLQSLPSLFPVSSSSTLKHCTGENVMQEGESRFLAWGILKPGERRDKFGES